MVLLERCVTLAANDAGRGLGKDGVVRFRGTRPLWGRPSLKERDNRELSREPFLRFSKTLVHTIRRGRGFSSPPLCLGNGLVMT